MRVSTDPLVSVVVCVYNAGAYLRPSIESILGQTYRNIEILIVDDGSTDDCMNSISDLDDSRIRVIRQENRGKPAAMNLALDQMRGEFYVLNDADDLSYPRRIELQVRCMRENPDVAAVYCGHELLLHQRRIAPLCRFKSRERCRRDIERFMMPGHDPTGMYRRSMVGDIRYESSLPIVEGFDYVLRVGERFPMLVLGECLYSYRIHPHSVTKRNPELRERLVWEVLRRACERRGLDVKHVFPSAGNQSVGKNRNGDNNLAAHFMESVCALRLSGERWRAIRTGLDCAALHPLDPHYHKALVFAVAPLWLTRRIRGGNW